MSMGYLTDAGVEHELVVDSDPDHLARAHSIPTRPSANCLDLDGVSRARGEWTVAGDERSVESFGKGNVYSVIRADVVAQLPRTIQKIYMGMPVEIDIREISNCSVRATGRDFPHSHETSESLQDFDVY
jgi:hypothetical protein